MAGPHPVGAMPHNIPSQLHQQSQAPQFTSPIPQNNRAAAASHAYMPVNAQPYRHPPFPPVDLRRQDAPEVHNARGRNPHKYRALRLEKASGDSSWERATLSESTMSQSSIRDRIEWLQKKKRSVTKKKQEENETVQRRLDKAQADLTKGDPDVRFYYKLVQLESEYRREDDRGERSSKRHMGRSKKNKSRKYERAAILAYFVRTTANDQYGPELRGTNMPLIQSSQTRQSHTTQTSTGGLPHIALPPNHVRSAPSNPVGTTPPVIGPRPNNQTKPTITQQPPAPPAPPAPQAQPPQQGVFNKPQQNGMVPARPTETMPPIVNIAGPAQGQAPGVQPQRLPPVQLPLRPPHGQGPSPVPNPPPTMAQASPGAPRGPFEAGAQPAAPKKIVAGSGPSVRNNIKVYHASDQSCSSSDNDWSEDESEGTTPSSVSSDPSSRRQGRGQSPRRKHPYHVIIQDSRGKEAKYVHDGRAKPPQQHARFDPARYLDQDQHRSPRGEYHSRPRAEESRRVEPPRIIQIPRHSVRHVPGPAPRHDSFGDKYNQSKRPLERARSNDSHYERDLQRDNDRFKHLEEDIRRRRDFRERRSDRRDDLDKYAESDSRWSDQQAREYMRRSD
ncbi:hypothetical protein ACLX1H_008391 [Fusarium chlamydosporum]